MSEELAPGSVSLEDEPATAAEPVAEPVAPPADPDESGVTTVDLQGQKLVPLAALKEARAEAKAAKALAAEVETLRTENLTARQQKDMLDRIQPMLQKLKDRPDLIQQLMGPAPAPADDSGLSDEEASDLARTLDLYTAEGQPDMGRARKAASKIMGPVAKRAEAANQAAMAPIQHELATGKATTLKQQYLGMKDKSGRTVNAQILDQMWNVVPAGLVAPDPNVAGVLYYAAKGYAAHHGLDEPAPPPPALFTESPGGSRNPAVPAFSELDKRIAKAMGAGEKTYTATASKFRPNAVNVLED